jgi:hypothetical protein
MHLVKESLIKWDGGSISGCHTGHMLMQLAHYSYIYCIINLSIILVMNNTEDSFSFFLSSSSIILFFYMSL